MMGLFMDFLESEKNIDEFIESVEDVETNKQVDIDIKGTDKEDKEDKEEFETADEFLT